MLPETTAGFTWEREGPMSGFESIWTSDQSLLFQACSLSRHLHIHAHLYRGSGLARR